MMRITQNTQGVLLIESDELFLQVELDTRFYPLLKLVQLSWNRLI